MTEFKIKAFSEQYQMEFEIVGFWDFDALRGSIHIYDDISKVTTKRISNFDDFCKYFYKLKVFLKENPDEFGDAIYEFKRAVSNAANEFIFEKEA